jgi:hypothetical protein
VLPACLPALTEKDCKQTYGLLICFSNFLNKKLSNLFYLKKMFWVAKIYKAFIS